MAKKKTAMMKRGKVGRGKPKGPPPAALRSRPKKKRAPRAVAPAPREVGLLDAIGEVMAICEGLAQEMHDWADNMPESKQSSQKHDEVEAAAETLDEAVGDDPIDGKNEQAFLNEIKITIQDPTPKRQARSRATQLGDATSILLDVIDKCEDAAADKTHTEEQCNTASEIKDALEDIESNLQGVEFPGMFG